MATTTDKNGLMLSNSSDSGYRFVTTLFEGPLAGKFIAFADVKTDELQRFNMDRGNQITGFFGFKNVVALGVFDDVRAAAYVGQEFYGNDADHRDSNLYDLFSGDESVIPVPPKEWMHDPDFDSMARAKKRVQKRAKVDVQQALHAFHKDHGADYNVKTNDRKVINNIRANVTAYLGTLDKPKQSDANEAVRLAFEPYRKMAA